MITNRDMKQINDYIQFAIDNGYSLNEKNSEFDIQEYSNDNDWCYEDTFDWEYIFYRYYNNSYFMSIEKLITSKPFIEAVARGVYPTIDRREIAEANIVSEQAYAIYNNTLDKYINNLIK